jgi:hypothetical protein
MLHCGRPAAGPPHTPRPAVQPILAKKPPTMPLLCNAARRSTLGPRPWCRSVRMHRSSSPRSSRAQVRCEANRGRAPIGPHSPGPSGRHSGRGVAMAKVLWRGVAGNGYGNFAGAERAYVWRGAAAATAWHAPPAARHAAPPPRMPHPPPGTRHPPPGVRSSALALPGLDFGRADLAATRHSTFPGALRRAGRGLAGRRGGRRGLAGRRDGTQACLRFR